MIIKKLLGDKSVVEKHKILLGKIDKIFKNKFIIRYCKKLSEDLSIPEKEIVFYFKKNYLAAYNFKKEKFENKILIFSTIKYFFINLFYILIIFVYKKKTKINIVKKYDLLIDDVSDPLEVTRYNNLKSYSKNYALRVNKIFFLNKYKVKKNKFEEIIYRKDYHSYNLSVKDLLFLIKMTYLNIVFSCKAKINFYYFFLKFINDYYFYLSFFEEYKFKHVISSRHFASNNIKNYMLKKNNGKSYVIQKNIYQENINCFFQSADVLFIFGNKMKRNKSLYFTYKKQIPVGSFAMENNFYGKIRKKNKKVKKFDILCLGGNQQYPGGKFDNDYNHAQNYIKHLDWLKQISFEYPELKVGFKHHTNNKNNYEKLFFKNSNVVYINKKLNSYDLCYKATFLCSWASTMVIEFFSINKRGFFLDPNYENSQYMKSIDKKIRINTYNKFKKTFFNKKNKETINLNDYCVNSKNTSLRIFNYLLNK